MEQLGLSNTPHIDMKVTCEMPGITLRDISHSPTFPVNFQAQVYVYSRNAVQTCTNRLRYRHLFTGGGE